MMRRDRRSVAAAWIVSRLPRAAVVLGALAATSPARANDAGLSVELNKLEPQGKGCRTYFVIANPSSSPLQALKLDLIVFGTDAIVARRLAVDVGPLRADKRSVKSFDLDGLACSDVGSLLLNDVLDCRDGAGPVADCLDRIGVSSRAAVPLTK